MAKITADEFLALAADEPLLQGWQPLLNRLKVRYRTRDFATGLKLVNAIGAAAEEADHHPDIVLTYPRVDLTLFSHDVGHLTGRDVALATRVGQLAADLGVSAEPDSVQTLELALDTPDAAAITPFWAAVYGIEPGEDEVVDPTGALPTLWFQPTAGSGDSTPAQRFHVDVTVPPHVAKARIAAVLAAGGVVTDDSHAPAWTVLADSQGNKACICATGRGE